MNKWHDLAIQAAYAAGEAILEVYNSDAFEVQLKSDDSPLTLADARAHEVIEKALAATEIPILSEEGASVAHETRKQWKQFWMVDPLDGTKEFIKRNGEFTVNIALVRDGKPVFGVVYAPVLETMFVGGEDLEPYKITATGERTFLKKQSPVPGKPLRVVASRSHLNEDTEAYIAQLGDAELVSMGSSLKFMLLADAQADVYPRFAPTMEWDTAAAHAVLSGMGIAVIDRTTGRPLVYNKEQLLNPHFCASLM